MTFIVHNDPDGPFGYVPADWLASAEDSLMAAINMANSAGRNVADWVDVGLPMDALRIDRYRRNKAAEQYARAVYVERAAIAAR